MTFQPGQSGNPKGPPKRAKLFTQALLISLKKTDERDVEAIPRIADKLVALAESGDVAAIKEVADRAEGKVPQAIGGSDELPDVSMRISWISPSRTNPEKNSSGTTSEPNAGPAS